MRDRCEYILYRGLYRTAYARVSRGVVTDTEMQIGQFVVPKHGETTGDLSFDDRYLRSYREDLPVEHVCPLGFSTSCCPLLTDLRAVVPGRVLRQQA